MMISNKDLKIFEILANKPYLFSVNKIEECYIFILGYSSAVPDSDIHTYINTKFTEFLKAHTNTIDGRWYQIIRYQATTDLESLNLFKKYFNLFLDEILASTNV